MPVRQKKDDDVRVYLTTSQKNQLKRKAAAEGKTVSEYLLDAGLATTLDTAKMDFYQNINDQLRVLRKNQHIMSKLLLLIGAEQLKSQDVILNYLERVEQEANKIFGED